jgi:hypothetical protein
VIVTAIERAADGEAIVTVMPITHREPDDAAKAVEIPLVTKRRSGSMISAHGSWSMKVINSYGRATISGRFRGATNTITDFSRRTYYLFQSVLNKARAWLNQHGLQVTTRIEQPSAPHLFFRC